LKKIDTELAQIVKHTNLTTALTPTNILEQQKLFLEKKGEYFPQFVYAPLKIDPLEIQKKVKKIEIPEVPMGSIFARKKDELIIKLGFLDAFSRQDADNMQYFQEHLWGNMTPENLEYAREIVSNKAKTKKQTALLDFQGIQKYVQKFSHIYDIPIICKEKETGSRFSIDKHTLLIKKGIRISTQELRSVIAHEIETHYLRTHNGYNQPYTIFSSGTAGYITCEE